MHWLAMAMSGSVSTFDITGTMWIVTIIYLFGMKSMWNHWMWGFLMAAFFMSYMGKWVRRSNVMTGAEWMVTRFGSGRDGRIARLAYTLMAVITLTAFVGYAFQGIGKFASEYITFGLTPEQAAPVCAILIFSITTLYVLLGGLYSVVITNVIQTVILTVASILIAAVAFDKVTPELLAEKLPADFTSLVPTWEVEVTPEIVNADYEGYHLFGALAIVWVIKGLLLNAGGPGQMYDFQLFLAAKNPRDASKLGAAWSAFLIVRWAMCMGIALLALTGLVAATGTAENGGFDAERVMPAVLRDYLMPGVRGLVIAGLLAAFMSTFSATVNAAASYIVRDLWQPFVRPDADQRHLVRVSRVATVGVVVAGTLIGFQAESIREVWDWIMMALGGAFIVPNVLRWYWWRLNGWGYAVGTLVGLAAALALPIALKVVTQSVGPLPPETQVPPVLAAVQTLNLPYFAFPIVCGLSIVGCLLGTWLTRATDEAILVSFFRTVRPFGCWGPIAARSGLSEDELRDPAESMWLTAINVVLASVVVIGAYLAPMYLVGHWYGWTLICSTAAFTAAVALYFTWYRNLPR
jgi:Na+/proline symporter